MARRDPGVLLPNPSITTFQAGWKLSMSMFSPPGEVRYFTVRESARLQTFPDDYVFHGSWSETMRQLGNAVPVRLAEIVGRDVERALRFAA